MSNIDDDLFCKAWTDTGIVYNADGRVSKHMFYVSNLDMSKARPVRRRKTDPLV
jgi:hypothetical protein